MTFDCATRNGVVVTESAAMRADVGIRDGRSMRSHQACPSRLPPDGMSGQFVAPGAIDVHTHFAIVMG